MDLIEDFIEKNQCSPQKPTVSRFFAEYEKFITQMNYFEYMDDLSSSTLKTYWVECFDLYKNDVGLDYNLVDWHGLISKITKVLSKAEADRLVASNFKKEELSDPFNEEAKEIPFNTSMLVLKPRYESLRRNAKRLDNNYKQGYLYYGVLDFVNKDDVNLTKMLLGTDYELWKNDLINTMRYG